MKATKILASALFFTLISFGASAQKEKPSEVPQMKEIPALSEIKDYYEFEEVTSYKLYDSKGTLVKEGSSKKVDVTDLKKGMYFFSFEDKRAVYQKD